MNNLLTKVPTDLPLSLMLRLIPDVRPCTDECRGVPRIHGWLLVALFALLASCASLPRLLFRTIPIGRITASTYKIWKSCSSLYQRMLLLNIKMPRGRSPCCYQE